MLRFRTFGDLIAWLVETREAGVVSHLADKTGLSQPTADKWVKGRVRRPELESVLALCRAYDLDLMAVLDLIGGTPFRGPDFPRDSARKPAPIAGGSAVAAAPPGGAACPITDALASLCKSPEYMRDYVRFHVQRCRRWWARPLTRPAYCPA